MLTKSLCFAFSFLLAFTATGQSSWQSDIVYYNNSGKLEYKRDSENNVIPDFSHAGYKGGEEAIPDVPVVKTITAIAGDNTSHIQAALDEVAARTPDANGFRGALLLKAGTYTVLGTVRVRQSGIVLRGEGDGASPASNTIVWGRGTSTRPIIVAGGGVASRWNGAVAGTRTDIVNDVLVGERVLQVEDASKYSLGDNIIVVHPSTTAWLTVIGFGGTHTDEGWVPGGETILYNRRIAKIEGNYIELDVPVYNHLKRSLSQAYIHKYNRAGIQTNIGIENLRVDIEAASDTDEAHAVNAIELTQIEDAWVRNCTALRFSFAGFVTNTATRVTIQNCKALDPASIIEGSKRYNYCVEYASSQILFTGCLASNGRHHYVSNGTSSVSGIVFHNSKGSGAYNSNEGHRRWSTGVLYDNVQEENIRTNRVLLGIYNRGDFGTGHGWSLAHSVAWNCDMGIGSIIIQKPPTAQNYGIGNRASAVSGKAPPAPFDKPEGYIEGSNRAGLYPASLYAAQLKDRTGHTNALGTAPDTVFSQAVEVSPNPNSGTFELRMEGPTTEMSLQVFDTARVSLVHQEMLPASTNGIIKTIRVKHAAAGFYLLLITNGEKTATKKLIFY